VVKKAGMTEKKCGNNRKYFVGIMKMKFKTILKLNKHIQNNNKIVI